MRLSSGNPYAVLNGMAFLVAIILIFQLNLLALIVRTVGHNAGLAIVAGLAFLAILGALKARAIGPWTAAIALGLLGWLTYGAAMGGAN